MTTGTNNNQVSLIGLGQMGRKLAQMYVEAGFDVQVWNRNPSKAEGLKKVKVAESVEAAILENTLIIICVYDNEATLEILNSVSDTKTFSGKTILNLTTGSPAEAEQIETMINQYDGHYLNGAIQVAPDQMGLPDTTILMAGDSVIFEQFKPALNVLGGNIKHLNTKAAASPAMDLATLTWLYGSYVGLIYGVKLCQSFGLKLDDYSTIIGEIVPGFVDFFKHEISEIDQDHFEITQSPLSISVSATQRIADTFKDLPVTQEFPQIISSILKQADSRGLRGKELAAIIKVIETPASAPLTSIKNTSIREVPVKRTKSTKPPSIGNSEKHM